MKKNLYIILTFFLMSSAIGLEKTKQEKVAEFVLENIQKDYKSCYAFYKIAAESFEKSKADKAIVKGLNESADLTLKFTHDIGEVLNFKPKIMTEDNQKEIKKLSKLAKKDFNKLAKIYGKMCKNLVENQKQRIDYWEIKGNKKIK